jgi:hypothetical protein
MGQREISGGRGGVTFNDVVWIGILSLPSSLSRSPDALAGRRERERKREREREKERERERGRQAGSCACVRKESVIDSVSRWLSVEEESRGPKLYCCWLYHTAQCHMVTCPFWLNVVHCFTKFLKIVGSSFVKKINCTNNCTMVFLAACATRNSLP